MNRFELIETFKYKHIYCAVYSGGQLKVHARVLSSTNTLFVFDAYDMFDIGRSLGRYDTRLFDEERDTIEYDCYPVVGGWEIFGRVQSMIDSDIVTSRIQVPLFIPQKAVQPFRDLLSSHSENYKELFYIY